MKHLLRHLVCRSLAACMSWWACPTLAHTSLPDSLGMAEVTASRLQPGMATGNPVLRLDTALFTRRGITDLADALHRLAGVNLRDYGGAGGLKTVSVRGLGAAHTAVAYDGLCLADNRQGQIDLQRYSLDQLQAIELQPLGETRLLCPVRNFSAAAVLNLTGWQPDTLHHSLHGTASLRQSSFGSWQALVSAGSRTGRHSWANLNASAQCSENDYPFRVQNGVASTTLRRTNSQMRSSTAEANFMRYLPQGSWRLKGGFWHNRRQLPGQVVLYVNENAERMIETSAFVQSHYAQTLQRCELFAAARYQWQELRYRDRDAQYAGGELRHNYGQHELYATGGAAFRLWSWLRMAAAADLSQAWLNSNLPTQNRASRLGCLPSVSAQADAGRLRLLVRAAAHCYRDEARTRSTAIAPQSSRTQSHHAFTPSASASWLLCRAPFTVHLRAGWQRSFRLPTFSEAYQEHLGQTDLLPERAEQLNAGLTLQAQPASWWPLLTLTADAYAHHVKNRIVSVPYTLYLWRTLNMGRVEAHGLDATLSSRWQPARNWVLTAAANYSLQRVADRTAPGSDTYGNQLAYTPRHSGAASLDCEMPWMALCVHMSFASTRWSTNEHMLTTQLPAYAEWGLSVRRSLSWSSLRLDLRADWLNVLNRHYEIVRRYPMPGRAYCLTARLHF